MTGDGTTEALIFLLLYAGAWLFAISGFRRGAGVGRTAAIITLGLLIMSVVFVLALVIGAARN